MRALALICEEDMQRGGMDIMNGVPAGLWHIVPLVPLDIAGYAILVHRGGTGLPPRCNVTIQSFTHPILSPELT